ncbi:L-aspartate oxidase [Pseudobdellovibrio exovorus]|uniref:L-aspartate oxidase n=1 Tax=Pseudobdellovibrio exovorus JSS TaxID=1184267 RepID=M4VSK4_9BACT|nr:L-aspartate oxidase [Pseudobdellovibrio exovorus]AGH96194.1 L-aspartate oxidase [Pseudobdellovibrio exovorus JSS]
MKKETDVVIIGSGIAALAQALKISSDKRVLILTKDKVPSTNSSMAQGGIAAVVDKGDSFSSHIDDTLTAGAGLCRAEAVRNFVEQAPDRIQELLDWGVNFDTELTREGGHSVRRILHHEDQTGAEIHSKLWQQVKQRSNISILENHFAIDLLVNKKIEQSLVGPTGIVGAYVLDKTSGEVKIIKSTATILATGGAGKVYLYTSNWSGATGDGIAMAYRAGARVSNLEFMQFHPTCLYHKDSRNFLISEALRGEGGELINSQGEAFMKKHHHMGSLAPRDIVARGIDAEMKKSGEACVYLDMTHKPVEFLKSHFPHIYNKCLEYGIDMATQPIPVVPAAHYLCGGVVTDIYGKTDLQGLFAIGETACTGFHGANRLASNSLLECLTMAHNCALHLQENWAELEAATQLVPEPQPWERPEETDSDEMIVISHMWEEIRRLMWNYVGIVRSTKRLQRAQHRLKNIKTEVKEYYSNMKVHADIIELRNIAIVADLTVECALRRHESRGIHFSLDYPKTEDQSRDTIL